MFYQTFYLFWITVQVELISLEHCSSRNRKILRHIVHTLKFLAWLSRLIKHNAPKLVAQALLQQLRSDHDLSKVICIDVLTLDCKKSVDCLECSFCIWQDCMCFRNKYRIAGCLCSRYRSHRTCYRHISISALTRIIGQREALLHDITGSALCYWRAITCSIVYCVARQLICTAYQENVLLW